MHNVKACNSAAVRLPAPHGAATDDPEWIAAWRVALRPISPRQVTNARFQRRTLESCALRCRSDQFQKILRSARMPSS